MASTRLVLLVDAGHGGEDSGAVSDGYREADVNLAVAKGLAERLLEVRPSLDVRLTRTRDTYMSPLARQRLQNKLKPTAFVSIHCNASTSRTSTGIETIYRDSLDRPLALAIQQALVAGLGLRDRSIKVDLGDLGRTLAVLTSPEVPSVLVELGFLTNPVDRVVITDTEWVVDALAKGLLSWFDRYGTGEGAPSGGATSTVTGDSAPR